MHPGKTPPFAAYTLENPCLRLQFVPELGGRLISLQSSRSGQEWMWWPGQRLKLFRNEFCDPFERSTLASADECVPTVAPCRWRGRALPDHGEVWSIPWLATAWSEGHYLETECAGRVTPFRLRRRIELTGSELVFHYRMDNLSGEAERFLWAFHPLFRIADGTKIHLPESVRQVLVSSASFAAAGADLPWPEYSSENGTLDLSALHLGGQPAYAKLFADFMDFPEASMSVARGSERLSFRFKTSELRYLGIWITRGGWHGYEHFALEPTNAPCDALADAPENSDTLLPGGGSREWNFTIKLEA